MAKLKKGQIKSDTYYKDALEKVQRLRRDIKKYKENLMIATDDDIASAQKRARRFRERLKKIEVLLRHIDKDEQKEKIETIKAEIEESLDKLDLMITSIKEAGEKEKQENIEEEITEEQTEKAEEAPAEEKIEEPTPARAQEIRGRFNRFRRAFRRR